MTALSNSLPGWSKRRRNAGKEEAAPDARTETGESDAPDEGEPSGGVSASVTASVTTGGGSSQEPVVVWEAANLMEAQVVKARLESEGIPAFIRGEALGVIYGLTAGSLARADVLVPGPLAEKAVELLYDEDEESEEDQA